MAAVDEPAPSLGLTSRGQREEPSTNSGPGAPENAPAAPRVYPSPSASVSQSVRPVNELGRTHSPTHPPFRIRPEATRPVAMGYGDCAEALSGLQGALWGLGRMRLARPGRRAATAQSQNALRLRGGKWLLPCCVGRWRGGLLESTRPLAFFRRP